MYIIHRQIIETAEELYNVCMDDTVRYIYAEGAKYGKEDIKLMSFRDIMLMFNGPIWIEVDANGNCMDKLV